MKFFMRTILPTDSISREPEFLEWLGEHGVTVRDCYKVETRWGSDEFTAYCYARNERGKKYIIIDAEDQNHGKPAEDEPVTIKMKRPIPKIERGR